MVIFYSKTKKRILDYIIVIITFISYYFFQFFIISPIKVSRQPLCNWCCIYFIIHILLYIIQLSWTNGFGRGRGYLRADQ